MTNEELNRKFDLVADHLANIAQAQMKADARIDRLERVLALAIRSYQRDHRETQNKINALIALQTRIEEQHERDHRETQDKINALIEARTRAEARYAQTEKKIRRSDHGYDGSGASPDCNQQAG